MLILFLAICLASKEVVLKRSIDLADFELFKPDLMVANGDYVFIWDDANKQISKFSSNLDYIKSFAKKGEGPGEITRPLSIKLLHNKLLVFDFKQRLIEFDLNGNYIGESRSLISKGLPRMINIIDGQRFVATERKIDNHRNTIKSLFFYSPESKIELASHYYDFKDWLNLEKTTGFKWFAGGRYIYIVPPTFNYCIISFDIETEEILEVLENKEYKLEEYPPRERIEMQKKLSQAKESPVFSQLIIKAPKYKSAIKSLVADENDTLYAITNKEKNNRFITHIYDHHLHSKGQITIPEHQLIQINKNQIYLVIEQDTYYLKKYLIK